MDEAEIILDDIRSAFRWATTWPELEKVAESYRRNDVQMHTRCFFSKETDTQLYELAVWVGKTGFQVREVVVGTDLRNVLVPELMEKDIVRKLTKLALKAIHEALVP